MTKLCVGILGATGSVGQRFVQLLENHPWFEVVSVAASPISAGKTYKEAVKGRWNLISPIPSFVSKLKVKAVALDLETIANEVDFVFSALEMDKKQIQELEIAFASAGIPVVSNNSAHRWTNDIPVIIPEVNPEHVKLIDIQRKSRGWKNGLIAVKPNCSIQSYVLILAALQRFFPTRVLVTSIQAVSGAGKTFQTWPEMVDNVIPFIVNEEEKSEKEPLKIWGEIINGKIKLATKPAISATCIRIPVTDGHTASISVKFEKKASQSQIIKAVASFNPLKNLNLPSSPRKLISYFTEPDRPQTKLDRDLENGMGVSMGRLREDTLFDWKFVALSHNTIRGAAGGAILLAELLYKKRYLAKRANFKLGL